MTVPTLVANAAINKTLRCAVEVDGVLLPILGGQTLGEQPPTANQESVNFFLITQSFPGEETPGQFTFGWGLIPGNPIEEYLINAGRNKTAIALDFRAPGADKLRIASSVEPTIAATVPTATGVTKVLSELMMPGGFTGWTIDDTIRVGNVLELIQGVGQNSTFKEVDLTVIAAIAYDSDGDNEKLYVKGRASELMMNAANLGFWGGFNVYDPNVRYRVSGTGISFSTDSTGTVPIGQLVMTMDTEPIYELIRADQVNLAYQY